MREEARWKDLRLETMHDHPGPENYSLAELIEMEDERQVRKFGVQTHSPAEWGLILSEELGELGQALCAVHFDGSVEHLLDVHKEAIQVATLALKIAEMAWAAHPGHRTPEPSQGAP